MISDQVRQAASPRDRCIFQRVNAPIVPSGPSSATRTNSRGPSSTDHADYRHLYVAVFNHGLQRWEDLFESEIPCGAEENECIRMWNIHI
jgi:hypothetical protein